MNDPNAIPFNRDWKFLLGDPAHAESVDYNDRTWKCVDLPHDWVISQPFKRGAEGYTPQSMQGYFAWEGVCWYRKAFYMEDLGDNEALLYFGGAYRNSVVYINGRKVGGRAYGYSSFELDITGFVKAGENIVALRLDNGCEAPDRWYSGSGLYRNVYLRLAPRLRIKTWGVHVTTKLVDKATRVMVDTAIIKHGATNQGTARVRVYGADNVPVAEAAAPFNAVSDLETLVRLELAIQKPLLWSADAPNLYCAEVWLEPVPDTAISDTARATAPEPVSDTVHATMLTAPDTTHSDTAIFIPFGIREIVITPHQRMQVNGEPVLLKGVCLHHDCGLLGSAYYDAAWRRRLLVLKSIGCNAIRTSHNPPAEEFLDLCDELGFYVIDECFDKWKSGYYEAHFDADWQNDLDDFIMRDRNHPSVFLWSVGNEIHNQGEDPMLQLQKMLASRVRALDERPVTCALAPHAVPRSLVGAPLAVLVERTKSLAKDIDVLGLNYHEALYQDYSAAINKPILGTESYEYYTSSASNFEDVVTKNSWRYVLENDNVLGQFIWAGIDYLGESFYPAKGWAGSILDICGFLKPNAYYRKSLWSAEPMVYLTFYDNSLKPNYVRGRWSFPKTASHLNFEHFRREMVKAAIYTNCDEVELLINGKLMGCRRPSDFENNIIEWVFEYAEGKIETIAYQNGAPVCTHTLRTAGPARDILLTPDTTRLDAGDIAHIEVRAIDNAGALCPTEDALVEFALSGDGVILGVSSPDLNARLGYTLPKVHLYGGRALLLIKAGASAGALELAAYSERLRPTSLSFNATPSDCS
ncbi:MAG: DUF4982 domain-containing protein [Treponema sp.]|jgi:beta-galactosidase|nr:DUF4982 domain-containing protein [Treponema sp.]